jgi:hypothetical protein
MRHTNTAEARRDPESAQSHDDSPHLNPQTSESLDLLQGAASLAAQETPQQKIKIRLVIFTTCLIFLVIGRASVPSNEPPCVVDKIMDFFQFVNDFIIHNPVWRNTLQIACSVFMDLMFLATGALWILRGTSSRVVMTILVFYVVRAITQALWLSPFPANGEYWWYDPGLPSLVVPYGKGSDFFFSGHVGFVTICALEWKKYGNKIMFWILTVGGAYTAFILLVYHVHYSIDLFVGFTFAHYTYMLIDHYKDPIDRFFIENYYKAKYFVRKVIGLFTGSKVTGHEIL